MNGAPDRLGQDAGRASARAAVWRDALRDDAETISAIEHRVHTLAHERVEVFREKIALFGPGCRVLLMGGRVVGYGLAYPWRSDDVPPLDHLLSTIPPDADCLFLHDVAILPEARAFWCVPGLCGSAVADRRTGRPLVPRPGLGLWHGRSLAASRVRPEPLGRNVPTARSLRRNSALYDPTLDVTAGWICVGGRC